MASRALVTVVGLHWIAHGTASQYDPHVRNGLPWFEGWYTRISETTSGDSIGIVTGYFPEQDDSLAEPAAYTALVIDRGMGKPIVVRESYPRADGITVALDDGVLASDPDFPSPPGFDYGVAPHRSPHRRKLFAHLFGGGDDEDEGGEVGLAVEAGGGDGEAKFSITQRGDIQHLQASYDDGRVTIDANFSSPMPFGPNGESPEGWAGKLPVLGLHWFVFSLGSHASYSVRLEGERFRGTGTAHQEKNWGTAFPDSWIWAEAASSSTRVALAGGPAPVGPVTVPNAFLLGYRSESLDWSFRPQDPSVFFPTVDACNGVFQVEARSAQRRLVVRFEVPDTTREHQENFFNVGGPTRAGFVVDSVESYRSNVNIKAYSGFTGSTLLEEKNLTMGAIEFGGDFRCGH